MSTRHSIAKSFGFAFNGLKEAFKNERNFRVQFVFAIIAIVLAFVFNLSTVEWAILLLTIAIVLILELINTSIEMVVDIISPEIQEKAKIAKDVSASAVFIASVTSVLIGAIIFLPKLLS